MTTIYLIRHGEIDCSSPRRFIGQLDLPLTQSGQKQIEALAGTMSTLAPDHILASPLQRCQQSAAIIARHCGIRYETVQDLQEIHLGQWEGLTVDEVRHRFPGVYENRGRDFANFTPADGESFSDLQRRVWPVFAESSGRGQKIALVTHAGVIRVLICQILAIPLERIFQIELDYGCLNTVEFRDGQYFLSLLNWSKK